MEKVYENTRLDQIPIIYARGTNSVVGFIVGRQLRSLIEDVLMNSKFFNEYILPAYETDEGKRIYEKSLSLCTLKFPQYVEELQGMATGARVPFYKLFLLNLEFFIVSAKELQSLQPTTGETGCSSVMCNSDNLLIGHTEDTFPELLNNVYILSAEILTEEGKKVEKFTTLAYSGCLPGYTMGFNEHGFIHTVNTLYPLETSPGKSPRSFIARSLLGASNLDQALNILRDKGCGITDAFSVNMHFAKQEGPQTVYNVEVCPNLESDESHINVLTLNYGETYAHCNKFLRHVVPELPNAFKSSIHRHKTIDTYPKLDNIDTILEVLSDQSDPEYPIFRYGQKEPDLINTVAVGIFDILNKTWSIYTDKPSNSKPIAIIPLEF